MFTLFHDLLHASRTLVKARAFTAVCVTSLGLGLGVVILILLFMRALLGTPPGVDDNGLVELVIRPSGQLLAEAGTNMSDSWSYPDYLDVRDSAKGMAIAGWSGGEAHFRPAGESRTTSLPTMYVSANYFSTIGVTLPLGPGFTAVDDASRAEPEAVISHPMWQVRLASDPNIIGRTITIDQTAYVVVGVAPEGFRGHVGGLDGLQAGSQLWLPLSRHPRLQGLTATGDARLDRETSWLGVVGRLPPGTTLAQADATVASVMTALAARYPASNRDKAGGVEPYFPPGVRLRADVSSGRMIVFGLTGMVLLIVGLNISGMLLVRSAMRERELAVRMAMGASRWRLVRYHLSEALVMAVFGGSLACAILLGGPVLLGWPTWAFDLWGPSLALITPDRWLVLQCIALCFVTSLVLGLLPAIRFSRSSILSSLKNDSAGTGRRVGWLQRVTAAAQAGIAVPFLVISGLQFDQARVAALTDVGFTPPGIYAARFNLSAIGRTEDERRMFVRTLQENLAQTPGIASVSAADGMPLDFIDRNTRVGRDGESTFVAAHTTRVDAGYLETLGIRLLGGRTIETNDRDGAEQVVVLSEPLARELFPTGNPVGERVAFALPGDEPQTYTVVGVTADLVSTQMGNPRPQLFVSLAQHPVSSVLVIARGAASDPSVRGAFENATADALRRSGQASQDRTGADPDTVLGELITGESLIENSRNDLLTSSGVGGLAAAVALALAALGVYGVIAFMVATRTREIGVRVALGASRTRVLRDVLGDALKLVMPGIGGGLVLAMLWVRLTDPAWYPLGGVEPLVYACAAVTAFVVALLAGIPSARRAAAVEPLLAMRAE
jgi:putative ABC transport system permease protein